MEDSGIVVLSSKMRASPTISTTMDTLEKHWYTRVYKADAKAIKEFQKLKLLLKEKKIRKKYLYKR